MSCADFRQNWDNIDYRHINHLTLHTVQAMELAKHVKTLNSRDRDCLLSQHFYMIDISQCVSRLAPGGLANMWCVTEKILIISGPQLCM